MRVPGGIAGTYRRRIELPQSPPQAGKRLLSHSTLAPTDSLDTCA